MNPVDFSSLQMIPISSTEDASIDWTAAFACYGGKGADNTVVVPFSIAPGGHLGWHTDSLEETQYIIAGSGELQRDDGSWPAGPGMPRPSPAAAPPARSPEPPPSACPPLTAPVAPVSPGFVPDRLRTTFAPRIGKPGQDACRATTADAGQHTHPSGRGGRRPHSRVTKRVRTYNHLPGGRHGAFGSKPARSSSG